jgi:hypothetical protein
VETQRDGGALSCKHSYYTNVQVYPLNVVVFASTRRRTSKHMLSALITNRSAMRRTAFLLVEDHFNILPAAGRMFDKLLYLTLRGSRMALSPWMSMGNA